jgi:hypothetical protein
MLPRHLVLLCLGLLASVLTAGDAVAPITLLVAPFENQSTAKSMVAYEVATAADPTQPKRTFTVDRYSEAPRAILEQALTGLPGVAVVERQRIDAMLLESDFGAYSGLVDGSTAAKVGANLGATVIVQGTVLSVSVETKAFSGYGIQTERAIVTATVRVRSIDIASGTVIGSQLVSGQKAYTASQFGGAAQSDVAYAVIEAALQRLTGDQNALRTLLGTPAVTGVLTALRIEPTPPGCDVLIDGVYRGTTPVTVSLPAGAAVLIRLEKPGLIPWERRVVPGQVPVVAAHLVPVSSSPAP